MRFHELLRELRPHAIWDGIKLVGIAGMTAVIVAVRDRWVHQQFDIKVLVTAFVVSLVMLLVGILFGGTWVSDAKTNEPTTPPQREAGSQVEIVKLQVTTL